jgi:hypothetical protein
MSGFEFNEDGIEELRREIQRKLDAVRVPQDGSEEDAVRSVETQYRAIGVEPTNHEAIRKMVRDARNG